MPKHQRPARARCAMRGEQRDRVDLETPRRIARHICGRQNIDDLAFRTHKKPANFILAARRQSQYPIHQSA